MKSRCLACGVEKDTEVEEVYPYPEEDRFVDEPIPPLLSTDCESWDSPDKRWRRATVCHECYHKLQPDMWISDRCWKNLDPVTPFEQLPLLEQKDE